MERNKGIVVSVSLPKGLVVEIDHFLADLPHKPNLFGRPRRRSGLIELLLRYALTHQEEALVGWRPSRNR